MPRGHFGLIVNRPTQAKLAALFPTHAPSRKVAQPLYLGGPLMPTLVIALARKAPQAAAVIPIMPGLVAVIDGRGVDRVIETAPNDARYFAGRALWAPGEFDE